MKTRAGFQSAAFLPLTHGSSVIQINPLLHSVPNMGHLL